uniref:Uncharacterized protein n=1 Tax=Triticum urartu TaxID=4572 RepID=A0A8R7TTR4_TRIUA
SLYFRALSTRRNPVTARRCFGTPARAATVGAPSSPLWEPRRRAPLPPGPEGQPSAVASGAWTDASRGRGVASVFRAASRLGAAFAGAEAVVCGVRSGRASRHARVRRASPRSRFRRPRAEAAPPHHGWCAGGRCRFVEVRAAPPR